MPKIRTVKPEFFRHEGLFEAEQYYQLPLRLAFVGLFTCCDREGRFRWRPRQLKLDIFPYDNFDMSCVLDALMARGFIVKYQVNGEVYGCIPSWARHQYINHRESASTLPGLDEADDLYQQHDASLTRDGRMSDITTTCDVIVQHETHHETSEVPFCEDKNPTDKDESVEVLSGVEGNISTTDSHENDASRTCDPRMTDPPWANPVIPVGKWKGTGKINGTGKEMMVAIKTTVTPPSQSSLDYRNVMVIFEHWKTVMKSPNAQLDDKRQSIILRALKAGYDVTQLCAAINGCCNTPHNMGMNEQGQRFDGLHIIFKDADQIDRFIRNFNQPPRQAGETNKLTQSNVNTMQHWLQKKLHQAEQKQHPESEHENQ